MVTISTWCGHQVGDVARTVTCGCALYPVFNPGGGVMKKLTVLVLAALFAIWGLTPVVASDQKIAQNKPAAEQKLDINSATPGELGQLPGIGEARAKAIVSGRPYKGKDELVQKKIIPEGVYDKIKDQIIAKQK
jgi:competence protein ComEA